MRCNFVLLCFVVLFCCSFRVKENQHHKQASAGKEYQELADPHQPIEEEWKNIKGTKVSWGSSNEKYAKTKLPDIEIKKHKEISAWKGERVNVQALVWSKKGEETLEYSLGDFRNKKGQILPKTSFLLGFVRYVMTDELNKDGKGACGDRPDKTLFDSLLVADPIDHQLSQLKLEKMNSQGIWIRCWVPEHSASGVYTGKLIIKSNGKKIGTLSLDIRVVDRVLPPPQEWNVHLDLWQNPYAVARYYKLPLWSEEHFDAMRPIMKILSDAGQKVITASIIHKPWNAQTEDYFDTMITWLKKADGTWMYDYTIFDRWVEFMMSLGIDKQINCYTMVPWALNFQYYDQATNTIKYLKTSPGEEAYEALWMPMLQSFSSHLKEKGWFNICTIAMDERPMDVMEKTIKIIKKADPNFRISLAGHNCQKEIEPYIYDYSISLSKEFPKELLSKRKKEKQISSYYISCTHTSPNTFTFSNPADPVWLGYYLFKDKVNGLLRWAYNSWVEEPFLDSRFRSWAAGDTYLVYPYACSSIRFEKLIEGLQAYEKLSLLTDEFLKTKNTEALNDLEKILDIFNLKDLSSVPSDVIVEKAKKMISELERTNK